MKIVGFETGTGLRPGIVEDDGGRLDLDWGCAARSNSSFNVVWPGI